MGWATTMNFLAHLLIAERSPAAMVGSLMPDLARGRAPADLPAEALAAFHQHRAVDAFTDTHPLFAQSRSRLRERHGRYAGILVDVFYDHFLATDWSRYRDEPLGDFIDRAHEALRSHQHLMPPAMRYPVDKLLEQDWLRSYATVEGIELALRRMSQRLTERFDRPVQLHTAVADLVEHDAALRGDFHAFFPQLLAYAAEFAGMSR